METQGTLRVGKNLGKMHALGLKSWKIRQFICNVEYHFDRTEDRKFTNLLAPSAHLQIVLLFAFLVFIWL